MQRIITVLLQGMQDDRDWFEVGFLKTSSDSADLTEEGRLFKRVGS